MIDYATPDLEAAPLKNTNVVTVVQAPAAMFSRLVFPKQVLPNQGSSFMGGVSKHMSHSLEV